MLGYHECYYSLCSLNNQTTKWITYNYLSSDTTIWNKTRTSFSCELIRPRKCLSHFHILYLSIYALFPYFWYYFLWKGIIYPSSSSNFNPYCTGDLFEVHSLELVHCFPKSWGNKAPLNSLANLFSETNTYGFTWQILLTSAFQNK